VILFEFNNEAKFESLGINLGGLIIEEEVAVVYDRPCEQALDDKLGSFEVDKNFHYSLFYHLDCVHRIARLKNEGLSLVLLAGHCVDELIQDQSTNTFSQELDLFEHLKHQPLALIVVVLHALLDHGVKLGNLLNEQSILLLSDSRNCAEISCDNSSSTGTVVEERDVAKVGASLEFSEEGLFSAESVLFLGISNASSHEEHIVIFVILSDYVVLRLEKLNIQEADYLGYGLLKIGIWIKGLHSELFEVCCL
jgi:hypothetical protein